MWWRPQPSRATVELPQPRWASRFPTRLLLRVVVGLWLTLAMRLVRLSLVLTVTSAILSACGDDGEPSGNRKLTLGETIGVNTHYGTRGQVDRQALALLRAAGVRTLRNDLDWEVVEKEPGVYDFSGSDELVEAASAEGLRLMFILDYGNRLYGPSRAVVDDTGRTAFANFARAAATRYRGRGVLWEVWNEPNSPFFWSGRGRGPDPSAYAQLVATTVPVVRAADPSATIFAGAVLAGIPAAFTLLGAIPHLQFLEGVFTAGVLPLIDGVTVHFYREGPPESVSADVAAVRALMRQHGPEKPVISGEWGYSSYDPHAPATGFNFLPAVSQDQQATYVARMILTNFSLGLPLSVWFKDRDETNASPGNIEHHWGLLTGNLSPKPAYFALRTLSELAGEGTLSQRAPYGPGTHGLVFDTPRGQVTALWSESPTEWRLTLLGRNSRIFDRDGREVTPAVAAGSSLFTGSDRGPFYLLGKAVVRAQELSGQLARSR